MQRCEGVKVEIAEGYYTLKTIIGILKYIASDLKMLFLLHYYRFQKNICKKT